MRTPFKLAALFGALAIGAACAGVFLPGCAQATSPSVDPRALARGAVETLETAWVDVANVCVATGKDTVAVSCEKVLDPVRSSLIAAGDAVNTWTDADQSNLPCMLADIAQGFTDTEAILTGLNVLPANVAQEINDGLDLAKAFLPQCSREASVDGGAQ